MLRLLACSVLFAAPVSGAWIPAGDDSPRDARTHSSDGVSAANVKQIFRTRCAECHGPARQEAGINLLDTATYVGADGFVVPGDIDQSTLFDVLTTSDEDRRMPQSPLPALRPDEVETIRQWIAQGAGSLPADVPAVTADVSVIGHDYVLEQILAFVQSVPREERRFYRFFSSNHLLAAGATPEDLRQQQQALAKLINHLTWSREIVVPVVLDGSVGSVLAVDIRRLGWMTVPYRVVNQSGSAAADVDLYDQVLLEYPYSVVLQNSAVWDELRDAYLRPAGLVRPIPYVRTDWFVSTASQSPLYEDMLQLPRTLAELERELDVHFATNAEAGLVHRAGMTVSGVSQNNRVVERHPTRYGAYWKSFDFETSRGPQNMFIDPLHFQFAGGEMIWNLPNGLQGYLITDASGNRIDAAPTNIVTDKFAADKVVRNGLACMRCHDRGMKRFADNIRPAFSQLPDAAHPDRREVLALYVSASRMQDHLRQDEARFERALEQALGRPQQQEPLVPVSRRFLDAPLTLSQAAGELGLCKPGVLAEVFELPEFTQLGLTGLTTGGVVRRDTWEDYYDRVVRQLGLGHPVVPIDGLLRADHASRETTGRLTLATNHSDNTFAPGDEMVVTVVNETGRDQYIELLGTDAAGVKTALTGVVQVPSRGTWRFPSTGAIRIQPQPGRERITLFAGPGKFPAGRLLRGERVSDRFVHAWHDADGRVLPTPVIRKTLTIETR